MSSKSQNDSKKRQRHHLDNPNPVVVNEVSLEEWCEFSAILKTLNDSISKALELGGFIDGSEIPCIVELKRSETHHSKWFLDNGDPFIAVFENDGDIEVARFSKKKGRFVCGDMLTKEIRLVFQVLKF